MDKFRRKALFVDRSVQGALLLRAFCYWCLCLLAVALMWGCWIVLVDRPLSSTELFQRTVTQLGPALLASLVIAPIVLADCLRLTNRFAGPIFRLRKAMRQLIEEGTAERVKLRDGDFWFDFAQEFNELADKYSSRDETPTSSN